MPSKANKLLDSMQRSAANWARHDLDTLYIGYGFKIRIGKKHDVASHPEFPQLRATLPRHPVDLAKGYISHAVKLINLLQVLEKGKQGGKNGYGSNGFGEKGRGANGNAIYYKDNER